MGMGDHEAEEFSSGIATGSDDGDALHAQKYTA
jgi:hypothetical protein